MRLHVYLKLFFQLQFLFLMTSFMSVGIFELDNLRPVVGLGVVPILKGLKQQQWHIREQKLCCYF